MRAARENENPEVTALLIEHGADVNAGGGFMRGLWRLFQHLQEAQNAAP